LAATNPSPTYLRPVERRRAFEEILFQLEEAIAAGHLSAGDRLPPERELATRFQVSRTSVREALRVLEAIGIVRVKRGAENGATLLEEPGNALAQILRFHLALEHVSMASLLEFRIAIESWAAGIAAERRTLEELARAEALLKRMESEDLDEQSFLELDLAFHVELARACGNELAELVMEGCRTAIARTMLQATLEAGDWPSIRSQLRRQHRDVYEAIRAGEPERASRLVGHHIRHFYHLYPQGREHR
jgi:GntR family transcriptional regulator, transcriptional repressor for pyruvate dehydrogenase complex